MQTWREYILIYRHTGLELIILRHIPSNAEIIFIMSQRCPKSSDGLLSSYFVLKIYVAPTSFCPLLLDAISTVSQVDRWRTEGSSKQTQFSLE